MPQFLAPPVATDYLCRDNPRESSCSPEGSNPTTPHLEHPTAPPLDATMRVVVATGDAMEDLRTSHPQVAKQIDEAKSQMPAVGSEFLGFRLIAELGSGAFGRVFLARQP